MLRDVMHNMSGKLLRDSLLGLCLYWNLSVLTCYWQLRCHCNHIIISSNNNNISRCLFHSGIPCINIINVTLYKENNIYTKMSSCNHIICARPRQGCVLLTPEGKSG